MKIRWMCLFLVCACFPGTAQKNPFASYPERPERERTYDVLHYRIHLSLDDEKKIFRGENEIALAPLRDDFHECELDAEDLTVTGVGDEKGVALSFRQADKKLLITLPRAYAYGEKMTVRVSYFGENPKQGLKFIGETAEHPAQVDTYSWPEEAHHWFPCYDYPNDKATCEFFITVRRDWQVLANGRLIGVTEDHQMRTRTYHWLESVPLATCLVMIAAGPYEVVEDRSGPVPVHYWVYPGRLSDARSTFGQTPKMIGFFNSVFGFPFPWEKYDQVCVAGSGGGLETASATILGDGVVVSAEAAADFPSTGLLAHELAHQWWGDTVTERDWSHVWLSESFATYAEYLFSREQLGEDEGAVNLLNKKERYFAEASHGYIRPIVCNRYENPWNIMDAHAYPKGALILHMLRGLIGDASFFRSLRYFLEKHAFACADTHDLQVAVKEATGQNLDWFLEQWIYAPGHPRLEISWQWQEANKMVRLQVRQTQNAAMGIPVFRMPAGVRIVMPSASTTEKFWISRKEEEFVFPAGEKPLLLRFDPDNILLAEIVFPKGQDELLCQLRSDDVIGRMSAAAALAKFKDSAEAAEALKDASRKDPFWAVRKACLEALLERHSAADVSFFLGMCRDAHSLVRAAALTALGEFRRPDLAGFLLGRFRRDGSFLAKAAALKALAACSGHSAVPILRSAMKMASPRHILKRTAESALKQMADQDSRVPY